MDRRTDVRMPQLGESVTEGTIVAWRVRVGDVVSVDDTLVEVSTDKVDSEIPSPVDGVVTDVLLAEGDRVPVGTTMLVIDGSAPGRDIVSTEQRSRNAPDGTFLSPAVRRRLGSAGVPSGVEGSGRGGRLTLRDLESAGAHADRPAHSPSPSNAPRNGETAVPFNNVRRVTAQRMVESLHTAAHTLVVMEVDYHAVDAVRRRHREAFRARHGVGLTYLPFIAHAAVTAVADYPRINARVGEDELLIRDRVNLGVAVDLDFEGLVVPVVHRADELRLGALAVAIVRRADRARDGSLTPGDVSDGTFTITNAGAYGTLLTAPVINQPQVAILSTDGIAVQPVAIAQPDDQYALGFHPLGNLCLSFDHRAIDGAYASAFLARVRELLQDRDWEAAL